MITRRGATAAITLVAAIGASATIAATAARAAPVQCAVVNLRLTCSARAETPGGPAPAPTNGRPAARPASGSEPTAIWTRESLNLRRDSGDADIPDTCTTADGQPGTRYRDTLLSPSGAVLTTVVNCVGEPQPGTPAAPPAPAPPPPPPSREELITSTPIPEPVIQRNPSGRGLTGLGSRFWATVDTQVEASVTLRGWTVTGTLGAGALSWDTGDGGHYQTTSPGTAERPAVEHVYEDDGRWPVTVNMSWSGSYTISGYGTSYTVEGLTAAGTASADYEVIEVRGVLD